MELASAYVQIIPSMDGIQGRIHDLLEPEGSRTGISFGQNFGSKFIKVAGGLISAAAIGKTITSAISEGADLEQSIGGIETLFKNSAGKVQAYAREAYATAGVSANDYMENVTSFSASLLQSLGGNTRKAAEIAHTAMVDMSDNANKMGTNIQDIQNAYQGFAKQNYTMLDNLKLGYGGTKTEMERLLADAQKLSGVEYNIDNLSDVYEAIHVIQEELDITGTTAKEASETLSGSLSAMKAAFSNLLGRIAIGENIDKEIKALIETTSTFLFGNLLPMLGNIAKSVPRVLGGMFKEAIPKIASDARKLLPSIGNSMLEGYEDLATKASEIVPKIMETVSNELPALLQTGTEIIQTLVNGFLERLPLFIETIGGLIPKAIEFFTQNLPTILQAGADIILNLVNGIRNNLPAIAESIQTVVVNILTTFVQNLPVFVAKGVEIISNLIAGILQAMPDILATIAKLAIDLITELLKMIPDIIDAGFEIMGSLAEGFLQAISDVLSALGEIKDNILNSVKDINLVEAGKSIINGFVSGLKSAWESGKKFIGGIGSWIAKNKGPISYDRKLLIPAGEAIMGGLNKGLVDNFKDVQSSVISFAEQINQTMNDHLQHSYDAMTVDASFNIDKDKLSQLSEVGILTNNALDVNQTLDIRILYESLDRIVERLDKLNDKELASYLDSRRVSRELDDPLRNYQKTIETTRNRMRGAYN